jgi:hypothetical protein
MAAVEKIMISAPTVIFGLCVCHSADSIRADPHSLDGDVYVLVASRNFMEYQ